MKTHKTNRFLIKTVSVAIATASLLVGLPSLAHNHSTKPTATKPAATKPAATKPAKTKPVSAAVANKNIVQVAVANGSFNTLVAAVKAAGLVDALSGKGPFTVFAPSDAAFAKLPEGTVEELLKPENKDVLVKILTYHVVSGKVMSTDIATGSALVPSLEGGSLKVTKSDKGVVIDTSKVTAADVKANNGVIHVIDTVLMPPDL